MGIILTSQTASKSVFWSDHFDTLITVIVTILGFIITYLMTKKNFKNEITKSKIAITADMMKDLPLELCELMDQLLALEETQTIPTNHITTILAKILAYGSKDAVAIAAYMQQLVYSNSDRKDQDKDWASISCYALLITQIKYDLTSEVISPDSWFKLKTTDYYEKKDVINKCINSIVLELALNPMFIVCE